MGKFISLLPLLILIAKDQDPITTLNDIGTLDDLVERVKAQGAGVLKTLTVEQLRADAQALAREAELVVKLLENEKNAATAISLVEQFIGPAS